jgi:hypothetical protein
MCGRNGEPSKTLTVITNRGKHLYFRANVEVNNSTGRIGAHIDVRGDGGYTVAPPSVHPSGSIYALDKSAGIEIADAPQWLIDLALPDNDPRDVEILPPQRAPCSPSIKFTPKQLAGVLRVVSESPEGERNQRLYWGACRVREMAAQGKIPLSDGGLLLAEAARRCGLRAPEIKSTLASGGVR